MLRKDENGNYPYSTVIWSDCKKSAKSSIAAAVLLYIAMNTDYAECYAVANDLKQADSRVNRYMRRALTLNPELRDKHNTRGYTTFFPLTNAVVEALPIDPSGEAGGNPDVIVFSELWGAHEEAKRRMFSEMTLSPVKFGKSFRWVETYAGYAEESLLLWELYERGVLEGERLWDDLEVYVNRSAKMLTMWNTTPRCPWQTEEYYTQEEAMLPPNEFLRLHRNQWVTSSDTFVPIEWWDACKRETLPEIGRNEPWVVVADAGYAKDSFAVLAMTRHPTYNNEAIVRYVGEWRPPKGGKLNFQGTESDPGPERELRRLFASRNVVIYAYDPYHLHDMAGRFRREGLVGAWEVNQGKDRAIADSNLRNLIRDRRVHHDGDPKLRNHIMYANAKVDPLQNSKIRLEKRSTNLPIDLAVCLSMASDLCLRLNL